jgi:tetratricopeptide (TPR) repeat protein
MNLSPSPRFIRGIGANIAYWQQQANPLTEDRVRRLREQQANLVQAVHFGLVLPVTQRETIQLSLQLFPLVERNGYWHNWLPLFAVMLDTVSSQEDSRRLLLLKRYGQLLRLNRELDRAIACHQEMAQIAQANHDVLALADAYQNLSEDYRLNRAYDQGQNYGEQALLLLNGKEGTAVLQTAVLNTLALIARERGHLAQAESHIRAAIKWQQQLDDPTHLARFLNNLAIILQRQKQYEEAQAYYHEALEMLAGSASELDRLKITISLGSLYFEQGRLNDAEAAFRQADTTYWQQSGDIHTRAILAQNLGNVLLQQQRYDEADIYLQRSEACWRRVQDELFLANTLGTLAELRTKQNQPQAANAFYSEALLLLEQFPENALAGRLRHAFTKEQQALNQGQ